MFYVRPAVYCSVAGEERVKRTNPPMTAANVFNLFADELPTGYVVARLNGYTLTRVTDDQYVLRGPSVEYPHSWLMANLPENRDWWMSHDIPSVLFAVSITADGTAPAA